jgi:putative nucleotidyltransferase with HDIG domain
VSPVPDRAAVRARVEGITKVVTIPAAVGRVMARLESGQASAAEIADAINEDPVLAAKVLKLVNGGFCGSRRPIASVTNAVVMLGVDAVRMLVLTTSVMDLVSAMNRLLAGLWQHSLATARVAGAIAERLDAASPEEYALSGLLHDLGKVIIAQVFSPEYRQIRALVAERGGLQVQAELEVLGVSHADVGFWLLRKWSLPEKLLFPIAYHHAFHPLREHADRTAVVHVADIIARAKGIGNPGDSRIPAPHPDALAMLNLPLAEIDAICRQLGVDMAMGTFA